MSQVTISFRPGRVIAWALFVIGMLAGLALSLGGTHRGQWWVGGLLCGISYTPMMFGLLYDSITGSKEQV